jgi:hypothetical protein
MGSWNGTCAISNLHITLGTDVVVFMLLKSRDGTSLCHSNAFYDVCPIPFYGKYDDYGGVEDCFGFGLNIVLEEIRNQLYEFGQGPNSFHDTEVNRGNFDIDRLFKADNESRLGIQHLYHWDQDGADLGELERKRTEGESLTNSQIFEMNRLSAKIKQEDTFRQVTHIIVHCDIFRSIMDTWYVEEYVGEELGQCGHGNRYTHTYFKEVEHSISELIARKQAKKAEIEKKQKELAGTPMSNFTYRTLYANDYDYNDTCLAARWMCVFNNSSSVFGLINVDFHVAEYVDSNDWDGLASFIKEALTVAWVNSYMGHTRKHWSKQTGSGGQDSDHLGHTVLANTVLKILAAENAERDE